jgi:hypothetical protein
VGLPQTAIGVEDAYPTTWLKAAALLLSIVATTADNNAY